MKVRVVSADPSWAEIYEREAQRLHAVLLDLQVDIHHIGSTAIRGIYAKPIIDILLVVQDLKSIDSHVEAMRGLGYESMGEFGIPFRRYFRKNSPQGVRTHQIHSFERGSIGAIRHLAFRDYMNSNAQAAAAYSQLKQELASYFPEDVQAYMNGKDACIKQHEAIALARVPGM